MIAVLRIIREVNMKLFHLLAIAVLTIFSSTVFAQPVPPAVPQAPVVQPKTQALPPADTVKIIKITKITGTVNIMKDGVIIMTLKP